MERFLRSLVLSVVLLGLLVSYQNCSQSGMSFGSHELNLGDSSYLVVGIIGVRYVGDTDSFSVQIGNGSIPLSQVSWMIHVPGQTDPVVFNSSDITFEYTEVGTHTYVVRLVNANQEEINHSFNVEVQERGPGNPELPVLPPENPGNPENPELPPENPEICGAYKTVLERDMVLSHTVERDVLHLRARLQLPISLDWSKLALTFKVYSFKGNNGDDRDNHYEFLKDFPVTRIDSPHRFVAPLSELRSLLRSPDIDGYKVEAEVLILEPACAGDNTVNKELLFNAEGSPLDSYGWVCQCEDGSVGSGRCVNKRTGSSVPADLCMEQAPVYCPQRACSEPIEWSTM